jgi:crotonobetainyl-CoA:carnitine CoA-transferase CaiB-like acyl-CoA transferase
LRPVPQGGNDDDALEAMIADFTRDQDRREAAARLQAAGLEAIAVLTPEDFVAEPHLRARGFFVEATLEAPLPGSPFHGDSRLADPSGPAPRVGEHGAEVRQTLAGIGIPPPS